MLFRWAPQKLLAVVPPSSTRIETPGAEPQYIPHMLGKAKVLARNRRQCCGRPATVSQIDGLSPKQMDFLFMAVLALLYNPFGGCIEYVRDRRSRKIGLQFARQ